MSEGQDSKTQGITIDFFKWKCKSVVGSNTDELLLFPMNPYNSTCLKDHYSLS